MVVLSVLAGLLAVGPAGAEPVGSDDPAAGTAVSDGTVPDATDTGDVPGTTASTVDDPAGASGASVDAAAAPTGDGDAITPSTAPVDGEYIVTLADVGATGVGVTARDLAAAHEGDVLYIYKHALRGFAVSMSEADALALAGDPRVAAVEENGVVRATVTQPGATWGLDRIDQRDLPLSTTYTYNATGSGVDAYIIDTGIRVTHQQFGGRASVGTDAVNDGQNGNDCNGHGTHVAGTVGGSTFGVAKEVSLIAVRVLNCSGSGSNAGVIAGVDWVTANHSGPSVANMSLGGGASTALDTSVQNSIASGVTYALAAGNDSGANACNGSPGRTPAALTVGSTTSTDARSSFSNIGTCVDIFAPGSSITSSWNTNDTATNTISGTSMATPHVAGAAALFLETAPSSTPAQVGAAIVADSTPGKVTDPGTGSPNRLLYTGNIVLGARITVVQDSVADAAQDFAFTRCHLGAGCTPFALDDDADPTLPRSLSVPSLNPGTYTITQAAVAGWSLSSLVCDTGETVDLVNRQVTIGLGVNEQVTCTFTNRSPSITVVEDAIPDSAQDFAFVGCHEGTGCGPIVLDDDTDATRQRSLTFPGLAAGTYTITQSAAANWSLSSLVCDTGETVDLANRKVTISLGAAEHATCTFTNRSASITVVQDTVPDNGQDFAFTGCQGAGCGPFVLDDDADPTLARSLSAGGLAPATYTITQSPTAGFELFALSCDTGETIDLANRRATITLTADEQVTCTFSNRVPPPANDAFVNAAVISGASGTVTGTNVNATKETGEPNHGGFPGGKSVWYRWTAPSSGTATVTTCGSSYDTLLGAYTGTAVNALTSLAGNDDSCGLQSSISFAVAAGVTYRLAVDGFGAASGNITLNWSVA